RIDEQLLRDAATDHAGAAHAPLLGDRDARAGHRRHATGANAATAAADDEEVVVVLAHGVFSMTCTPSSRASSKVVARPTKRPCSTTPTIRLSASASAGASPIWPKPQS